VITGQAYSIPDGISLARNDTNTNTSDSSSQHVGNKKVYESRNKENENESPTETLSPSRWRRHHYPSSMNNELAYLTARAGKTP
jgi:hypothetical protein